MAPVNRSIRALSENTWRNRHNNSHAPVPLPVPVSEEGGRARRSKKRRAVENLEELGDTVRGLGSTFESLGQSDKDKGTPVDTPTSCHSHSTDSSYIILPYGGFLNFEADNFCCRFCFEPLTQTRFEKVQVGFATSINYFCTCKEIATLEAETKKTVENTNRYAIRHSVGDYAVNVKLVLALQQIGSGETAAGIIGGMLQIGVNLFRNTWTRLEEAIGAAQIIVANTVINENIKKEKELSEVDIDSRHLFCVSIDAGWNNRGSGKTYNSDSCHHITVGNRSGLVVALHYMSKRCGTCESAEKKMEKVRQVTKIIKTTSKLITVQTCAHATTMDPRKEWSALGP
jgi:hypothetical protein